MKTHKRLRKVTHESTVPRTTERCSIGGMWIVVLIIGWLVVTPAALTAALTRRRRLSAIRSRSAGRKPTSRRTSRFNWPGWEAVQWITDAVEDPLKATVPMARVRSARPAGDRGLGQSRSAIGFGMHPRRGQGASARGAAGTATRIGVLLRHAYPYGRPSLHTPSVPTGLRAGRRTLYLAQHNDEAFQRGRPCSR